MHIVIVALHRASKPTGICRHAANLAQCLVDTQKVTKVSLIVGAWQQHYFEQIFHSHKIQLISVDIKNSSLIRNFWFLIGLPKLVRLLSPDIVHMAFPLPFLRHLFSCPVVSTIHDLYPYEKPEVFGYPHVLFNRLFLQQSLKNSDGLACVSESTLNSLKRYFPNRNLAKEITVIYNYVDFSHIIPKQPSNINIGNHDFFLLCVAQHRKHKNIDLLIEAFYFLIKDDYLPKLSKLIIVGNTGPETEKLYKQIDNLCLQEQVLLINSLKDEELCWLYTKCAVFVAPSSQEGFCLPLVEALYFSCQVVCSDIAIFREIASPDCYYFDIHGDTLNNLSQAIIYALEKPVEKNAHDLRFSQFTVAGQYLELYSKFTCLAGDRLKRCLL
jgi:glycosyltransferase involved in cell wall biosynthesis